MNNISIYYDDTQAICRQYIDCFLQHSNILCKAASNFSRQSILFETSPIVGFVCASDQAISHVIETLVMDKKTQCFIIVTGCKKEIKEYKNILARLNTRGYHVTNGYIQYRFDKYQMNIEEAVERILRDIKSAQKSGITLNEQYEYMKQSIKHSKGMRKKVLKEWSSYKKYQRTNKNIS